MAQKTATLLARDTYLDLVRAHERLTGEFADLFREHGLTAAQYNVLRILRGSPGGLETHEVVERMVARAPNITRLVDKREKKRYLRRERPRSDRRVITLHITREGLEVVELLRAPLAKRTAEAMSNLSPSEIEELIRLLNRLATIPNDRREGDQPEESR